MDYQRLLHESLLIKFPKTGFAYANGSCQKVAIYLDNTQITIVA